MTAIAVAHRRDTARVLPVLVRWTGAAALVCAVHAGAIWFAMNWIKAEFAAGEAPPAVMIELAPLAVAPEAPPQEVAPGPQVTEAEPEPTPPDPQAERVPVEDTPPPPAPEPEIRVPETPPVPQPAAVVPPPPPPRREVERPRPQRPPQRVERPRPPRPERTRVRQTTAPPASQAQRADTAAAAAAGAAASAAAQASWRGSLMAHLNRFKRFPPGASTAGVAQVAFTIDRSGRVLSSRLVRGSGDSALDSEAVAMMRRASPVPAPPPGVGGGGSITLAVPVRFNR